MSHSFDGQVAIVTGGARGIGLGIARQLKADGARVVIWDLDVSECDTARLGFEPDHLQSVDVSSYACVERAFEATVAALGHVDILVNNAGINGPVVPSWEYPVETWQRVLEVDLNSVFYGCRVAVPHMRARGGGRILNVASIAGKEGVQFISAYSAAKAGVIAFTKSAAKELARDNVLMNCVAPAMVETELFREMSPEHIEASKAKIPLGRFLQIEEVGRMVSWIVSPACSFTTGFTFDLTGGRATY
ncbi:SDR family NAD(P)-dependent oxidoreductase [Paraburkholderia susongensis]|uniref:3-oxoacyl-[acyl-carrier protein] reductase n=1 Tax=Paraburkholderia susongensis TaxID=1515439 RepID=A0A1X7HYX8_9BURK|nr:SDR family NAD(P)-dependent oxidoreductase [Paraburkholderia susongensis]SMG06649.1 3-oxoacyl-[acyl-carrier protein] reductase [Paraburkholderia susongensis]